MITQNSASCSHSHFGGTNEKVTTDTTESSSNNDIRFAFLACTNSAFSLESQFCFHQKCHVLIDKTPENFDLVHVEWAFDKVIMLHCAEIKIFGTSFASHCPVFSQQNWKSTCSLRPSMNMKKCIALICHMSVGCLCFNFLSEFWPHQKSHNCDN